MNYLKKSMVSALCFTLFAGLSPVTVNAEGGGSFPHEETSETAEGGTYNEYETGQKEKASDKEERVPREGEFQPNNEAAVIDLNPDEMVTVDIDEPGKVQRYRFVPETEGYYTIRSYSKGYDPKVTLYEQTDDGETEVAFNDDGIQNSADFRLVYYFLENTAYYFDVALLTDSLTGSFDIKLIKGGAYFNADGEHYVEANLHDTITLRVTGTGDTSKAQYQWYCDDKKLEGEENAELVINDVTEPHQYTCGCDDGYGYSVIVYFYIHVYREIETIAWNESMNYEISTMQQYVYFPEYITVGPIGSEVSEVSYSSSNAKVLSIESDYPYRAAIQGTGTTTITAYSSKDPSIKATHKFTVYKPVAPTSMKASGDKNITFYYRYWYNTGVLGVRYSPDHSDTSTTWESSNNKIIEVYGEGEDPGYYFTGTGGPVTVTAKSTANPKLSVKFNITIVDQDAPLGTFDTELEIGKVQNPTDRDPEHSEVNPQVVYMDVGDIYYMKITDSSKTCVPTSQSGFLEKTEIIEGLVSSSDLYIDNGILYNVFECNIKAIEEGVYTISRNGKTTTLVVRDPGASGPSSIDIDESSAEMATQSTLKLNAAVSGENQDMVVWTSSDPDIAIVDSTGLVTALRYGKATITAASAYNSSISDTCEIQTRFYDVNDPSKYYYNPVYWAADKGITTGYDRVYFGPQKNCTRQELAIFLWRLAGEPSATGNLPFSDTKYSKTSASYKAILWCSQQGIVKGYSDGTFRPKNNVTRKDTLIMLYRLAGKPEVSGTITFPDVVKENYAPGSDTYKAILWGVQNGITNGYKDGNFQPKTNCLREHIVTFIYRADKVID